MKRNPVKLRSLACLGLLLGLLPLQTGCFSLTKMLGGRQGSVYDTTMLKAQGYSLPPGGMPSALPAGMIRNASSVVLEIRGDEPKMAAVALPEGQSVTIEDFARKADLPDQLGHCQVSIMRPNGNQPPVRLDVRLNAKGKADNPARNYGVRPGDHIIVIGDGRSNLERFVDRHLSRS